MVENLLKMIIVYPRPCWYSSEVECLSCTCSFGDPSGHMLSTSSVILYAFFRLKANKLWLILVFLFEVYVGYYRIYEGLHTYSQLFSGLVIGAYLVYIFITYNSYFSSFVSYSKKIEGLAVFTLIATVFVICSYFIYLYRDVY